MRTVRNEDPLHSPWSTYSELHCWAEEIFMNICSLIGKMALWLSPCIVNIHLTYCFPSVSSSQPATGLHIFSSCLFVPFFHAFRLLPSTSLNLTYLIMCYTKNSSPIPKSYFSRDYHNYFFPLGTTIRTAKTNTRDIMCMHTQKDGKTIRFMCGRN